MSHLYSTPANRSRSRGAVISADLVQPETAPLMLGGTPGPHGETHVEVLRQGDDVVSLRIVCRCGEETILHCDYAPASV